MGAWSAAPVMLLEVSCRCCSAAAGLSGSILPPSGDGRAFVQFVCLFSRVADSKVFLLALGEYLRHLSVFVGFFDRETNA